MGRVRFELTIPWFRTKIERYEVESLIESYQARLPPITILLSPQLCENNQ